MKRNAGVSPAERAASRRGPGTGAGRSLFSRRDASAPTRLYYAVLITLAVEVILFYVFTRMLA